MKTKKRNSKKKKKFSLSVLLLNIAIGIAGFMVFLMVLTVISENTIEKVYYNKAGSFVYRLNDGDYNRMVQYYHENEGKDIEITSELREFYALARFYEAAVYYKGFQSTGDTARAAAYAEKMKAAERDLGELSGTQKKVLKLLEIENP